MGPSPARPTPFVEIPDFLDPAAHRALLAHLAQAVARLPAVPPAPGAPDVARPSFDVGPLRAALDDRLRGMVGHLRRELGVEHFVCSGIDYRIRAYDGSSVTSSACDDGAGATPRLAFVYTCHPPGPRTTGGRLRLFDTVGADGVARAADTVTEIELLDNAIVVLPADRHHEITRTRPGDEPAVRYAISGVIVGEPHRPEGGIIEADVLGVLQQRFLPSLSQAGFEVRPTPAPVQALLESLLVLRADRSRTEETYPHVFPDRAPELVEVTDLGPALLRALAPLHEEFAGVALEPSNVYGLRRYRHGNRLGMHRDRAATHVVSSVLQVAQDVDAPWPLAIEIGDRRHEVFLEPGQMLLYEGATQLHGRPSPLRGRAYVNLFAHYRPVDWPWTPEVLIERARRDGLLDGRGRLIG
jgi:hypothetical protein